MKISLIVPVYNVSNYLRKCLESIINQTYKNIEIIIINDGSIDNSYDICLEYKEKDKRIKLINQENMGLSEARNTGLKYATGDYIWFIDSDDYIELNSIELLITYLKKYDIVVFNYSNVKDNSITKIKSFYDYNQIEVKYLLSHCNAWNKIFKKDILENELFPKGHIYEDLYLIPTLILKTKKIKFLDEYLYNYVYRNNSIKNTKNNSNDRIYALNNLYIKLNKLYPNEIEYLYIYNLLMTSLIEEVNNKCKHDLKSLNKIVKEKYPKYYKNIYWNKLGILKKNYLILIYYNILFIPRMITYLKIKVLNEN